MSLRLCLIREETKPCTRMATLDQAFGTLADADHWEEAGAVLAGFLAPSIVANVTEGSLGYDAPNEVYGAVIIALAQYSPMYSGSLSLGGGVYTVDQLLDRFGLKQTITQMGGS